MAATDIELDVFLSNPENLRPAYLLEVDSETQHLFQRRNLIYQGEITLFTAKDFYREPRFGQKTIDNLITALANRGAHLGVQIKGIDAGKLQDPFVTATGHAQWPGRGRVRDAIENKLRENYLESTLAQPKKAYRISRKAGTEPNP